MATMTTSPHTISYRTGNVDGLSIFYRAGRPDAPTILLLHGFPSSSQMYGALRARRGSPGHRRAHPPFLRGPAYSLRTHPIGNDANRVASLTSNWAVAVVSYSGAALSGAFEGTGAARLVLSDLQTAGGQNCGSVEGGGPMSRKNTSFAYPGCHRP